MLSESEMLKMSDAANKERCLPNTNDYDSKISIKLANVKTILVKVILKAPVDFEIAF